MMNNKASDPQLNNPLNASPSSLPTGTLTFLFTDIEGSTRLWEFYPEQMRQAMRRHDTLIETAVAGKRGAVVRPRGEGDSRFAVFKLATDAVEAAIAVQRDFNREPWPLPNKLRVRIAVHTGQADLREGDYYGSAVNRCARLRSVAHGGQILISQATYNLASGALPAEVSLRDLGEYKLKDLSQPERIYQVMTQGLETDFPALKTLDYLHTNLPVMLTSFIGREREIAEVKHLLAEKRLLTISGFGGAGKTRLALEVAKELLAAGSPAAVMPSEFAAGLFADGIWFIELAPLSNAALVTQYVMKSLGLREEECCSPQQTLIDALRQKDMLLVLDNCEHLLPGVDELVDALLRGTMRLKILATSRENLGVAGETIWHIPALTTPKLRKTYRLEDLLGYESVQLFLDRAFEVNTAFRFSLGNAPAIAQICVRLDGIPLAIELAAARVRLLSAEEIAARLDDRFRLLVGNRTRVARQRTLKNLIDWSHDLLPESECILLRRLSVFSGGWTLRAAEEVCTGGKIEALEVLDLLANLVDKSLVISEEQDGLRRYRLLETIRQYADDRLGEVGEDDEFTRKHAEYFTRLVDEAYGGLWGAQQAFWLEQLDTENDNIHAALEWLDSSSADPKLFLHLAGSLWKYWEIRGQISEGRAYLELALERIPDAPAYLRANGLRGAGMLAVLQGDYEQAIPMHQESLRLFREVNFPLGVARELDVLGEIANSRGEHSKAVDFHMESLAIRYEIADKEGIAHSLGELGVIARERSEYEKARDLLEESLQICRGLGDKLMLAQALSNLGLVEHDLSQYVQADRSFAEALALFRELDDLPGIANTLHNQANVAKDRSDFKQAIQLYEDCLTLREKLGDKSGIARTTAGLAEVAFYQGKYPLAIELAEKSLVIFRSVGVKRGIVVALVLLAYASLYQGDCERSISIATQGLALSEEVASPRAIAYSKNIFGLCDYSRGKLASARELLQEAMEIFEKVGDKRNVAYVGVNLARTAYRQNDLASAKQFLEQSISLSRTLETNWTASHALEIMGLLERQAGHYRGAMQLFKESLSIAMQEENLQGIANNLGAMAGLAALTNQPWRAARLFAAADKISQAIGASMSAADQEEYGEFMALLQEQLDKQAFDKAWSEGYALTVEQLLQAA